MDYFSNPPPGMDLSEDRTRSNNAIGIVLFILSAIAVGLRVLSRTRYQHVNLALDDYLMFLGLALNAGNLACCIAGGFFGLGKHIYSLQPENMAKISIITFAYVYIYAWSVCIIKYSILALYRRIFGMSWLNWWGIFLTTGYLITNHITLPLYCKPLSYYWNQWYNPAGGHCPVNEAQFYLGIGIINLFGDVCILVVPVQHVLKLQMNRTKKMAICVMFLLGGFVCIASLIRITTIVALTKTTDISWAKSDVFIWSSVEPSFGIISGCLPTLRPLIVHVLHKWFGYHDSQGSKEQPDSHQLPTLVTISKKKTRKIPGLSILEETQVDKSEGTVTITDTTTTTSTQRHSKDLEQGKQDQSDDEICLTSQHEEENDHHILRVDEVSVESDVNSTTKDANSQYNRYGDPFHGHRS